jgi:CheY-like chemotaxis protein
MSAIQEEVVVPRLKALVVDDSKLACFVLGRMLERQGFDVELAHSAEQALDTIEQLRPAVVFMDHLMSGMSGIEAVRKLRGKASCEQVPVVMYTSQGGAEFEAEARAAGANAVLAKHSERLRLAAVLQEVGLRIRESEPSRSRSSDPAMRDRVARTAPSATPQLPDPAVLVERFEPVLREQRDQIRTELLAEFALLENGQESVRRQVLRRVDESTHAMARRLERELKQRDEDWLQAKRSATRQRLALAASILLPIVVLGGMVATLKGEVTRLEGAMSELHSASAAQAATTDRVSVAGSQLLQRAERTAATLDRIERRLAELPAAISTADAAADAYCLRDDGFGSYRLEPAPAGVGCTPGVAPAAVQRVAALASN